jgi:thioredoxin reductase
MLRIRQFRPRISLLTATKDRSHDTTATLRGARPAVSSHGPVHTYPAHSEEIISNRSDTVVVGAGPYGLSIAAHLRARGLDHRVIGTPLHTWRSSMPKGMHLKSDGFASNLSAPAPNSTLEAYCREHDVPYHPTDIPVPVETFIEYGLDFQRRFVPHLEQGSIVSIANGGPTYRLALENGEELEARRVVVAVGITHFAFMPPTFASLPSDRASHSSAHHDLTGFAGRDVTVIGAGSSAVELAVGLAAVGARSRLIARAPSVKFAGKPEGRPRSLLDRMRQPSSGLGPGIRSRLCCDVPGLFRFLPRNARAEIVKRHLGPSSPWYLQAPFESSVEALTARTIRGVDTNGHGVAIELADEEQATSVVETDHVICATGYRPDLARLTFIEPDLRTTVKTVNHTPALDPDFESSVSGLFFAGISAAMSFGPLMRFMYGDEFAAEHITDRIAKSSS